MMPVAWRIELHDRTTRLESSKFNRDYFLFNRLQTTRSAIKIMTIRTRGKLSDTNRLLLSTNNFHNSSAFELDNDDSNATRIHDTNQRLLPSTTNKKFNVKFGCNGFTRDRNNNERNNIDTKSKIEPIRDRAIHPLETRLERRDTEIRRYRSP